MQPNTRSKPGTGTRVRKAFLVIPTGGFGCVVKITLQAVKELVWLDTSILKEKNRYLTDDETSNRAGQDSLKAALTCC